MFAKSIALKRMLCNSHLGYGFRCFWTWINFVSNKVDHARVKEVGADRAAAEWVLHNGGKVKFIIFKNWTTDYNRIPAESASVEAIDVSGVHVMDIGLEHLADLKYLQSLNLQNCKYITDRGLVNLEHVRESLQVLDISGCPGITDRGLPHLYVLKMLNTLNLQNTPSIKDRQSVVALLQKNLPNCNISH